MSDDDSGRVEMVHPELPDAVIRPKAGKTGAYSASGWILKSEAEASADEEQSGPTPAKEPAAAPELPETPDPAPAEDSEPKKRRTTATEKKEA